MKFKVGDKVTVKHATKQIYSVCSISVDTFPDSEYGYKLKQEDGYTVGWWRESSLELAETDSNKATEEFSDNANSGAFDESCTFPWEHEYPRNDCDGGGGYGNERYESSDYERGYKQGYEARKNEEGNSLLQAEYEDGMNNAWEIASKIMQIPIKERAELFGISQNKACFTDIASRFSVSEAADKLKAWKEKNKIKVGDEIVHRDGIKGVVVGVGDDGQISVLNNKYDIPQLLDKNRATKTGRHFDAIEEVLKQMQEEI